MATSLKGLLGVDDALDIFAAHGVGGFIGNVLTAFFADNRVASFDGSALIPGGWINHHWVQLGYQLADSAFTLAWSFSITLILLFVIDRIPGLHFRTSENDEIVGIDLAQIGEPAYFMLTGYEVETIGDAEAFAVAPTRSSSSDQGLEKAQPHSTAVESENHQVAGRGADAQAQVA